MSESHNLYSLKEVKTLLSENSIQKALKGQGCLKKLKALDNKLCDSIYRYTQVLEDTMKTYNRYSISYNLPHRVKFILEYNLDIEKLRCSCGKTYSWTGHCRHCSELKNTLSRATQEQREKRIAKQSLTMRKKVGEEIQKQGKSPRYDLESISILNIFAEKHGLLLQHAEKGGEYYIKELGYWVDGYDREKNVVVEIDEPFHFRKNLVLPEKDRIRHKAIQEYLNCVFYRLYYNPRTGRLVLYNTPEKPDNWDVNKGIELVQVEGVKANGTKRYCKYSG